MRKVLIYGDSNSFGTAPTLRLADECVHALGVRWGDVMAKELGAGWQVVTEGLPGRTAVLDDPIEGAYKNGLTVMPAIVLSHRPIDVMVICLGTNDQKARFGLGAQDVALGVMRLAREAMALGVVGQILVVAPPPLRERGDFAEMFAGAEARCAGLAGHMARFSESEGVAFLDAGEVISVDPLDGIHWAAETHAALGPVVADRLRGMVA